MSSLRYFVGFFQLTLPNRQNAPSCFFQVANVALIACDVRRKLRLPKHCSAFRCCRVTASSVSVPEASMHKDDFLTGSKNQIWAAGKFRGVQSIPVSQTVHEPTKSQFWTGILRVDCSHDGRALFSGDMVRHTLRSPNERPLIVDVFFGCIT